MFLKVCNAHIQSDDFNRNRSIVAVAESQITITAPAPPIKFATRGDCRSVLGSSRHHHHLRTLWWGRKKIRDIFLAINTFTTTP